MPSFLPRTVHGFSARLMVSIYLYKSFTCINIVYGPVRDVFSLPLNGLVSKQQCDSRHIPIVLCVSVRRFRMRHHSLNMDGFVSVKVSEKVASVSYMISSMRKEIVSLIRRESEVCHALTGNVTKCVEARGRLWWRKLTELT